MLLPWSYRQFCTVVPEISFNVDVEIQHLNATAASPSVVAEARRLKREGAILENVCIIESTFSYSCLQVLTVLSFFSKIEL